MTINELGKELRKMYDKAGKGEQVLMIHLFGIKYSEVIRNNKISKKDIVLAAGIHESYHTEVNKGVNIGKYAKLK